jgi:hypothetical protein
MAPTVAQLRAMSEDDIVRAHDETTSRMATSSSFYLDELRRRDAQRVEAASYTLARRAYLLAWVNGVNAAVAAAAAVIALAH